MQHQVVTPDGPFTVSLGRNIWTGQRFILAHSAQGLAGAVLLRGRLYRICLRLEEDESGAFRPRAGDGLLGCPQRQLPDGRWISGEVLLPADRRLLPAACEHISAWALAHAAELARETVDECRELLTRLAAERAECEATVAEGRERLAYLQSHGWNTDRVLRRLTENEEWLARCDQWEAQAREAIARFRPTSIPSGSTP